jgi:hypothetical protein
LKEILQDHRFEPTRAEKTNETKGNQQNPLRGFPESAVGFQEQKRIFM